MPQSPIDIVGAVEPPQSAPATALEPRYAALMPRLEHNQWTVLINMPHGSTLTLGDELFELMEFHFHEPSEHYIEGKRFALEAHFVHKKRGTEELAVMGVMIEAGAENELLSAICSHLPQQKGDEVALKTKIDPQALLPSCMDYYRFMGSRTTEPYTEGVRWFILTTPITASLEQIDKFHHVLQDNARQLQPLKNRDIFICCR